MQMQPEAKKHHRQWQISKEWPTSSTYPRGFLWNNSSPYCKTFKIRLQGTFKRQNVIHDRSLLFKEIQVEFTKDQRSTLNLGQKKLKLYKIESDLYRTWHPVFDWSVQSARRVWNVSNDRGMLTKKDVCKQLLSPQLMQLPCFHAMEQKTKSSHLQAIQESASKMCCIMMAKWNAQWLTEPS